MLPKIDLLFGKLMIPVTEKISVRENIDELASDLR